MKTKTTILAASLIFAAMSCNQPAEQGYVINGKITGNTEDTIYLKKYTDKEFVLVDSAVITNSTFTLKGKLDEPAAYALTTDKSKRNPLIFFLENKDIKIELDETDNNIKVEGSPLSEQYFQNLNLVDDNSYSIDSLVTANPSSSVAAYFFMRNFSWRLSFEEMKTIRSKFDKSLDGSIYVQQIDSLIKNLSSLQVGAVAPDFTLPDTTGTAVSLSSFRGKYVLVDFWASWCPDCRKENPNIVKAYEMFKDQNIAFLGVSLDSNKEQWLKAIEKDKLTWTHVSELKKWDAEIAKLYAIRWIPQNYLIDPNGVIVAKSLEGEKLTEKLKEIFEKQ